MRALQLRLLEGPDALELVEVGEPEWQVGTVLIDVHAAGASFPDLLLTRGEYQIRVETPFVPGIEVAGIVRQAPAQSVFAPGDRVSAVTAMGEGVADVALAPAQLTFPAPDRPWEEFVALTINYQTAWLALTRRGRVGTGETLVVHGAGGGVGTAAIEIAKAPGADVLGLASTAEKADAARRAGAKEVYRADGDWVCYVRSVTNRRGADVVIDSVSGERFGQSMRAIAPEGRLLVVGFAAGEIAQLAANRVLLRQCDVVGINCGGLMSCDPDYPAQCAAAVARLADQGKLDPQIGGRYPLAARAQALQDLESRVATGELVIDVRA